MRLTAAADRERERKRGGGGRSLAIAALGVLLLPDFRSLLAREGLWASRRGRQRDRNRMICEDLRRPCWAKDRRGGGVQEEAESRRRSGEFALFIFVS